MIAIEAILVGHLLRRCHQVHNVLWAEETGGVLTSPQYSVLSTLAAAEAALDQHSIGQAAGLDRSTTADIVRRLEGQGWIRRERDPRDGRRLVITMTVPSGVALAGLSPAVHRVQDRLLSPLPPESRPGFTAGLARLTGVADPAGPGAPSRPQGPMDDRPGHLIRLAQQRHTAIWAEELEGRLTGPQFAVLAVLGASGPLGQGDLAEASAVDRSSASEVLGRLEARGWTVRSNDPADRRTRQVSLTSRGEDLLAAVRPAVLRVQARILEPVAAADRDRLVGLLSVVARSSGGPLARGTGGQ